ncbi:MAG: YqgE/AlgH family protein [Gammaproteobacteria bacterium]|nr:YqgE/AlgH family protein [Gammaproteobacteria bacterium]
METLQNHLLIAMPSLRDPYFSRSVTYICDHNDKGAFGLVINQPSPINLGELLHQVEQVEVESLPRQLRERPVFTGGPVSPERGFVIHSGNRDFASSVHLADNLTVTTSRDILQTLARNDAPDKFLVTLGYAGWSAGQLEEELASNSWITIPADAELLFDVPISERWQKAAARLGIDLWRIAPDAGHA